MLLTSWIAHICEVQAWETAQRQGEYRADSLDQEGFIHASRPEQVLNTANRYYHKAPPLVLLWIDPARLQADVRDEPVGADTFPHIFGPINLEAVVRAASFTPDSDGFFRQLPEV